MKTTITMFGLFVMLGTSEQGTFANSHAFINRLSGLESPKAIGLSDERAQKGIATNGLLRTGEQTRFTGFEIDYANPIAQDRMPMLEKVLKAHHMAIVKHKDNRIFTIKGRFPFTKDQLITGLSKGGFYSRSTVIFGTKEY